MGVSAVDTALAAVQSSFGVPEGLMADLPADAVWVRAQGGEFMNCVSRLAELWAQRQLGSPPAHVVLDEIADRWPSLTGPQARSIELLADTLWAQALTFRPGDTSAIPGLSSPTSADVLLGELVHLDLPMVRWLEPWVESLDGPGAQHLADSILRPSRSQAWALEPDARGQLEAWAATEPVVMGLAVVGGIHLDEGDFGELLDRLV